MNNVYIAYLDEITQDDLVTAKKIEADDKLILLTGDEPYMPCSYFYFLRDLNVEPEFVTIENNILITGFMLGLQCANQTGNIHIISSNEAYGDINDCSFTTAKGKISVNVYSSFADVFVTGSKKASSKSSSSKKNVVEDDDTQYPPASEEFKNKLVEIDTKPYNLSAHAGVIAYCIKESTDETPGSLELQLCMRFGEKTGKTIAPTLNAHFSELAELV